MKIKFPLFLISIVFCTGCSSEKQSQSQNNKTYEWKVAENDSKSPFNNLNLEYITLSNEPSNKMLGTIDKIIPYDDELLIKSGDNLNIYDEKGKYIRSIGMKGRGGNEYLTITDVSVHNGIIYILDSDVDKVLSFSVNGEFISKKDAPISLLEGILAIENGFIFFRPQYTGEEENELYKFAITTTDLEMNIVEQKVKYGDLPKISLATPFIESENEAYFNIHLTDFFTQVDRENGEMKTYTLDFLEETANYDERENMFKTRDKRFILRSPIIWQNFAVGQTFSNSESNFFMLNINSGIIYEDTDFLSVFPGTYGFDSDFLYIPHEMMEFNKNHNRLPESIRTRSENGENVIIKASIL